MTSNAATAHHLETKLLENYNQSITDLREHALRSGVEICIQADGLWLHRPGYGTAARLEIPTDTDDWYYGKIFEDIMKISDALWGESDGYTPPR